MYKKVLMVGGGPGGCMTANRLAKSMRDKVREEQWGFRGL